jgi:tetratricopeptide (TPR) repeat protein
VLGVLCLAASLLAAQPAHNTPSPTAEQQFQAAMAAQDQGNLDKAESLLLALRSRHPGLFAVDESLGLLYIKREQFASALPVLEAAANENPSSAVAHANLGADDLKLGKTLDAVHELRIAAKLNSKDRDTQSNLGQALAASKQPAEAAKAFAQAVALDPEDWDLRCDWAGMLLDSGDADHAANALAPIPNPETMPRVQALLAELDEKHGRFLDAAQHLQTAAKLDPSEANLYSLGMEYLKHWTFEPAAQFFEYGAGRYPTSQRMLLGLGIARYAMNQLSPAATIFAQLLDADQANTTYAELLGRSCTLMPDTIQECDKLERFAEAHPEHAAIDTYAAISILARSGETANPALATKLLDEAILVDPKLAEAHLQKAILLENQEEWRESIPELETSITLRPESSKAHYRLALAYAHTGNREKAQKEIALQKKYREQEKDGVDSRLRDIPIFLMNTP